MGKINVLSFAVANLIAAGEVVDRPSSVIKELVENAIDAGATRITVETQNGGVTLMRVTDNGCGMERDDLAVAVRRHATSKIKDETDLSAIMTLGFRGEALAAIAAVSDLRIISKTADAEYGSVIEVSGGVVIGIGDRAAQTGTTVMVENLFANVPARRKFLKKDVTETMAINAVVEKIALSHPEISFRLITDGTTRLETVGDGNLKSAVHSVFGRDFARALIEVNGGLEGIKVSGFCGRSDNCKVNRNFQNIFINGRYVKSRTAQAALEQAYVSYIPPEKFPVCILNIEINPALVDVNVHPSKLEVKFSNEKPVFEAVYYSVRAALEQNATRPEMQMTPSRQEQSVVRAAVGGRRLSDMTEPIREGREESLKRRQLGLDIVPKSAEPARQAPTPKVEEPVREVVRPVERPVSAPTIKPPAAEVEQKPIPIISSVEERSSWRIIGEAFNSYIIVERAERLILIDKHAAHERIIFERLKANMRAEKIVSQMLMLPIEIMLRSDEIAIVEQYRSEIEAVGFGFSSGRNTVSLTELPDGIDAASASDVFSEIAGRLISQTGTPEITRDIVFEKALYQASCKAAIKAGREYPKEQQQALVEELMAIPDVTFCPHGRPVAMELSKKTLDRQFSRS
ncbi:MAG: DNA mismatch repair endonuclease MutL [Clostridia bacterium]|nr:DNA mismatch repair endonuclease MutL [Clostridia bacterium]